LKLYKFRSLAGEGFVHALDMVVNERIFLSTCDVMNDPSEGSWIPNESLDEILESKYLDLAAQVKKVVDSIRFTSFTDSYKNELLWSHYAGGFTGVCFEYELDEKIFDIQKILYSDRIKLTLEKLEDIHSRKVLPQELGILRTKTKCWEYESEYRLYGNIDDNNKYINARPTKVIMGTRKFDYNRVFASIVEKYEIELVRLFQHRNDFWLV